MQKISALLVTKVLRPQVLKSRFHGPWPQLVATNSQTPSENEVKDRWNIFQKHKRNVKYKKYSKNSQEGRVAVVAGGGGVSVPQTPSNAARVLSFRPLSLPPPQINSFPLLLLRCAFLSRSQSGQLVSNPSINFYLLSAFDQLVNPLVFFSWLSSPSIRPPTHSFSVHCGATFICDVVKASIVACKNSEIIGSKLKILQHAMLLVIQTARP